MQKYLQCKKLKKQFEEYPDDNNWIQKHFELSYVELENREPQIRMAIFKKNKEAS